MQKENKVIVKLNCFPGPCRTGENRGSRFFVSDGKISVRSKIGRCRFFRRPQDRQNTDFNVGLTPDLYANLRCNPYRSGVNPTSNKGFTLIELLVVVLIIGLLAAVALPQYQKAVWKSRYVQAKTMGESLAQAEEIYYLANGEYTSDINALSIDVPAKNCGPNSGTCSFSWGHCTLLNPYKFVRCYVYKNGAVYLEYERWLEHSEASNLRTCATFSTNASDTSNQICKAETGRSSPTSPQDTRWLWNYF